MRSRDWTGNNDALSHSYDSATSTTETLTDLATDLIMANNNNIELQMVKVHINNTKYITIANMYIPPRDSTSCCFCVVICHYVYHMYALYAYVCQHVIVHVCSCMSTTCFHWWTPLHCLSCNIHRSALEYSIIKCHTNGAYYYYCSTNKLTCRVTFLERSSRVFGPSNKISQSVNWSGKCWLQSSSVSKPSGQGVQYSWK